MCPDAAYFIILLSLTADYLICSVYITRDDFTHQGESAATQWVNTNLNSGIAIYHCCISVQLKFNLMWY
jgi:hypothetical protein